MAFLIRSGLRSAKCDDKVTVSDRCAELSIGGRCGLIICPHRDADSRQDRMKIFGSRSRLTEPIYPLRCSVSSQYPKLNPATSDPRLGHLIRKA